MFLMMIFLKYYQSLRIPGFTELYIVNNLTINQKVKI